MEITQTDNVDVALLQAAYSIARQQPGVTPQETAQIVAEVFEMLRPHLTERGKLKQEG